MSAQGLLSSVFSCSLSPRTVSKRKLRQTRSLDPALVRYYGTEAEETPNKDVPGQSIGPKPVPLQSLSELERVRLQDVAFRRLLRDHDLGCHITIPKCGHKHKKLLRRKLDSLSKEKNKDKETVPQVFGIPLSQVISNDRTHRQRHDAQREEHSDPTELMLSFLHLTPTVKGANREFSSSTSSLSSTSENLNESGLPAPRTRRRGGVSVDCITDLDDNQSRLLEALQLSLPEEGAGNRKKRHDKKLSLNPIYRQVPRIVDLCCQHLEKYALQTVGIFRVGSSKKRVRQLREEFDQGWEVHLDEEHTVHDVAALLKEFLRDLPDPLLTRELYTAFINTLLLDSSEQEGAIQLLIFLLPSCNSDTLLRLLGLLSTVTRHAEDTVDDNGREITGNKMTSLNLATIFGPNLLHKQKHPDKEFLVQSFARAEDSSAIISVVQRMINTCDTLFMVPPDLQNEVLMNLLETDPDVVDYLLRRKACQHSQPSLLRCEEPFTLTGRCMSNDSFKASSGEVSPYDNNSPVLSDQLLCKYGEDSSPLTDAVSRLSERYKLSDGSKDEPENNEEALTVCDSDNFWDTWQELFSMDFVGQHITGSPGDMSECESYGSSEGLSSHQGNNKLPVSPAATLLDVSERRPRPPVIRSSSGPHDQREQSQPKSPLHQGLNDQSATISLNNLEERTGHPLCPLLNVSTDSLSPFYYTGPLTKTHNSQSTPSLVSCQSDPQTPQQSSTHQTADAIDLSGRGQEQSPGTPDCQTEKLHIWQILSKDNADALPETLV